VYKSMLMVWRRGGYTLVELIIAISIIATLIGILLPAMARATARARGFQCQMSQRSVAFDFQIFADEELHGDRGDDGDRSTFRIETFQESQYGVDEFWRWGKKVRRIELPDAQGNDPMRCPDVRTPIFLRNNLPCSSGAVGPSASISYGFNARLHRAERVDFRGRPRLVNVKLRERILSYANVPLLMDIDGARAQALGVNPIYVAPSLGSQGPYANDRMWFPSLRHSGKANVAFVDGHVKSSSEPAEESTWDWDYQPIR